MKDLDFDELDRAVNSLITNAPIAANTDIPEKTLEIEPGPTEQLLPAATIPQPSTFTPSPLMARRSTGRFMDVVPPSVNTRVNVSAPDRTSRQGLTIAPAPAVPTEPVAAPVAPVVVETPAPAEPTNNWPDPIDFSGVDLSEEAGKTEIPAVEDNEDADIDAINNEITNTLNQTVSESLDSPFISGTKVEKRPLGAFSEGVPAVAPEPVALPVVTITEPTVVEAPITEPLITTPVSTIAPFPAELSENLLSIESGGSTTEPAAEPVVETPAPEVAPVAPTITVADAPAPLTVTNSIAQQYTEQPSSGDQTSGAIYDTDAYHKALVTPSKKKSGWLWVIWISILLVVGAAAGAAVYFLVLPNLSSL